MKNKFTIASIIISIAFIGFAFTPNKNSSETDHSKKGIDFFNGTWEEALKLSQKENKIIFLDAYASWCGPCKLMANQTFVKKDVGEYFNKNFINYKMDMEKHSNGPRLSRKFRLTAYPTLYFVDGNENIVQYTRGYQSPQQLISIGKSLIK